MIRNLLKRVLYTLTNYNSFRSLNVELGYVFHTEKIYDDLLFNQLLEFCEKYYAITNARPICTIIPPTNALLNKKLLSLGFSEEKFIQRVVVLSNYSTIGYHGHYYLNDEPNYYNAIHCNSFNIDDLKAQFKRDINWFTTAQIDHNQIYAGGWWFFNKDLLSLLLLNGFKYDFTFSKATYFYNQFSNKMMNEFKIKTGESFSLKLDNEIPKIKCIQNFIGMHSTPFPEDFDRNFIKILEEPYSQITGVVNSHDYDLDLVNTIKCVNYQKEKNNVKFISFDQLIDSDTIKEVSVDRY